MMQTTTVEPSVPPRNPPKEHRYQRAELFGLVEIDRASVVDCMNAIDGYEPEGVYAIGAMRELCPACKADHLKLVLRQKRVRLAHLFCATCNKCFDACYPDGSSALELDY